MALELIKATALILALGLLQGFNARFWRENQSASDLFSGLIFGGMCVVGMLMPIVLAPGLIFDGRSAVLAMASVFGGPLVGAVAGFVAAAHRLSIGGPGAAVGVTVIAASVLLGLGFRAAAARGLVQRGFWEFLAFGVLVHGVVLIIFNWLPAAFAARIYDELALTYVLTLAPATALLGLLLQDLERRTETERALVTSEARMHAITEAIPDVLMVLDEDGRYLKVRAPEAGLLAAGIDELKGRLMGDVLPADKAALFLDFIQATLASQTAQVLEYELDTITGTRTFEARARALDALYDGRRAVVLLTRDITERVRLEQEQRIAAIAFESQQGMMITDARSVILRVNKAFTEITGYAPEEAIGHKTSMLSSGHHDAAFYQAMWASLARDGVWEGEIWNRRRNGEVFPERLSVSAVRSTRGEVTHYVAAFMDITHSKAAEDEIRRLAFYDALTGLPNRRLMSDRLNQAMAASARSGQHGALMFIDLDDFKNVNDLLGHHNGDLLLQKAGARLRDIVRETDTVARFGGDEFVVLLACLSETADEAAQQAERIAEAMLAALSRPYMLDGHVRQNSASIGVAMFKGTDHSLDEMMRRADLSMYESKQLGKNRVRFFDPVMRETVTARLRMEDEIRSALAARQFDVFYQPQCEEGHGIVSAEALLRWRHHTKGYIPPVEFIPVAERAGLMPALGRYVMREALDEQARWARDPVTAHLTVAINISAAQLYQPDFTGEVLESITRSGADPHRVVLELTESILLDDMHGAIAILEKLREHGIRFSIDDFGTGYSSLGYLQSLPINELKIDRSFVRELPQSANSLAIVKTIVALASALDMKVIAEGVESESQRAVLFENGCRHFQGYLFARPLPADEFSALVHRRHPAQGE
ncbi:MAG: EAL domain-containing protein [Methyloversatilis sp.]|jgi:diguanylate cyclase (GGDEF)-like protein/PAS domain S-box-containing protein|nr:EAL domain-containing protein [Methyloversatilis sp.]MBP6193079.1 EAL domain-containing protein [Methyloversatilis sp.]MBP9116584.1 EAL domain-containing protein [Methyloversatilis sp.]